MPLNGRSDAVFRDPADYEEGKKEKVYIYPRIWFCLWEAQKQDGICAKEWKEKRSREKPQTVGNDRKSEQGFKLRKAES